MSKDKIENEKIKSIEERIKDLKVELKKEIYKVVQEASSDIVRDILAQYGITGELAAIKWDFEEEYDDEGGTIWYPYNIRVAVDGNSIDLEEVEPVKRKSKYSHNSGKLFDYYLDEDLNDFINAIKGQLTDYAEDEELIIPIGGQK